MRHTPAARIPKAIQQQTDRVITLMLTNQADGLEWLFSLVRMQVHLEGYRLGVNYDAVIRKLMRVEDYARLAKF